MTSELRSMLFAPGNKLELLNKFSKIQPDAAIIDLEDAVPHVEKKAARENLLRFIQSEPEANYQIFTRVNPIASENFEKDIQAVPPQISGIVIPKVNTANDLVEAEEILKRNSVTVNILVGIETVKGLTSVNEIFAMESVTGAYFGAEDYIHDLGGVRTQTNNEVLFARTQLGMNSRLFGVPVVDQIVTDFSDNERFIREAQEAKSLGFVGKLCIHPSQVPLANESFSPTQEEIARARKLLEIYERAISQGTSAAVFDGQMIDEALAKQARRVLNITE